MDVDISGGKTGIGKSCESECNVLYDESYQTNQEHYWVCLTVGCIKEIPCYTVDNHYFNKGKDPIRAYDYARLIGRCIVPKAKEVAQFSRSQVSFIVLLTILNEIHG